MGSTDATSIISQMEQEMEDLQQMHYSTEYSTDINSKMQVKRSAIFYTYSV